MCVCTYVLGGIDYNSGPFNVTFSAGSTFAFLDIAIIDDGVLENDSEMFFVTVHPITEGLLMQISPTAEIPVRIIDTTGKMICCIACMHTYVCT